MISKQEIIHKIVSLVLVVGLFSGCDTGIEPPEANGTVDNNTSIESNATKVKLFPIDKSVLFSDTKCSQIIIKMGFTTCYDYGLRSLTLNAYELDGALVNAADPIDERPRFYAEESIPGEYRAEYADYYGYDRGHMRADASSDYNQTLLDETYSLGANIVAQTSGLNRYVWSDVERYSRRVAKSKGMLKVINIPVYDKPAVRNSHSLAIAKGFYKILYTGSGTLDEFAECYYYENIQYDRGSESGDTHTEYEVNCATVEIALQKTTITQ